MKSLPISLSFLGVPEHQRRLKTLGKLLIAFALMVGTYATAFHWLMEREGQEHSWTTAVYWVVVVMSTLGLGDITFHSDLGRLFSIIVVVSGSVFMLVLLPFMFIQFFYLPWAEAQAAARAPRELPETTFGHVILTGYGSVERALIRLLLRARIPYVLLVAELAEALRLHDDGVAVMLGDVDDPATYTLARVDKAALVVSNHPDTTNTNIAFTVREISTAVSIVTTAKSPASVDILELAGSNLVLQLGQMLGEALARRVLGSDAKCHVIERFGDLLIAEAAVAGTPLVGKSLKEIRMKEHTQINVIGIWDRGQFRIAGPETRLGAQTVLLLAGTRSDLDSYDAKYGLYGVPDTSVLIVGGGRVGKAAACELSAKGIAYRIVEKDRTVAGNDGAFIIGDAAELAVLEQGGIRICSSVVITSHDDDVNVYLTIYCRRLRPDVHILARANQDRNVSTLHRAGADFVMSYASMGARSIYNMLKRGSLMMIADGLDVFRAPVPGFLAGRSLAASRFRQVTGCNVVAIEENGICETNPDPHRPLPDGAALILIGDTEAEDRFYAATS